MPPFHFFRIPSCLRKDLPCDGKAKSGYKMSFPCHALDIVSVSFLLCGVESLTCEQEVVLDE